ncbi:hypothetical protein CR194_10795 [Salipaludibacillus keqinensis]|uniref:Prepilin-type cleavage/methylation domain-containing protein n=2 Tax=Salipaludibacillus keqinensis TaxID=2045207 RepID=A0A323TF93_9BACI|nr:hypothetical protein CR194_10795 [Salipaludibacillus keqinensis]
MTYLKYLLCKRAFTLIETMAGLLLISIILISFFSFFGQSLLFSSKAEDNYSSTNLVNGLVNEVEGNEAIINYLENTQLNLGCNNDSGIILPQDESSIPSFNMVQLGLLFDEESESYYYPLNNKRYVAEVKICQQTEQEVDLSLFRIHGKISESGQAASSEVYHYINLK